MSCLSAIATAERAVSLSGNFPEIQARGYVVLASMQAQRGNLPTFNHVVAGGVTMMPCLARLRVLRQWGGVMDMSMDGTPIIGKTPIDNLYLNGGWCYGGFKATPASGWVFAHTIAHDKPHKLNADFTLERFREGAMPDDMPELSIPSRDGRLGIAHLLREAGLVGSTSEAFRMIKQGAVKIDGARIEDRGLEIDAGTTSIYQVGKRRFARVSLT